MQENSSANAEGNAEFAKNITFPIEAAASQLIYNIQMTPSPDQTVSFKIVYDESKPITPFVRFYTENGEEVYWEYTLMVEPEGDSTTYKISQIPAIVTTVLVK